MSQVKREFGPIVDVDAMLAERVEWRPMRIAVVGGRGVPSTYSGVETICDNLFAEFARRGHEVTVYCRPSILSEPTGTYRDIRLVRTPAFGGPMETPIHTVMSCRHAMRHGDVHAGGKPFDLVSFHAIPPNLAQRVCARAGVPTISHVHGLDHQREKWRGIGARIIRQAEREMLKYAAEIVTVNRTIVRYYRDNFLRDAILLPNGIHPVADAFSPDVATLQQFGLTPGRFMVTISRLVPEKRHDDVIRAFAKIPGDWKLAIVGEGTNSQDYVERIKKLSQGDPRVVFTGKLGGDALQTLFRSARLYLSASELEGLPSSLLECMDRNVCAIVSDIPPHRELMEQVEGYDLLFDVGNVDQLAERIARGLASEAHTTTLAARARAMVRARYAWPVLAEATERLYLKVLRRLGR